MTGRSSMMKPGEDAAFHGERRQAEHGIYPLWTGEWQPTVGRREARAAALQSAAMAPQSYYQDRRLQPVQHPLQLLFGHQLPLLAQLPWPAGRTFLVNVQLRIPTCTGFAYAMQAE
jgi:hypothetical protein